MEKQSVGDIHGMLGRADLPSPTLQRGGGDATGRMTSLSRQKPGPWGGLRLRGVGPAQPAAALSARGCGVRGQRSTARWIRTGEAGRSNND